MRPFLGRPDLLTSPPALRAPSAPGAEGLRGVRGGVWSGGRHLPPLRRLLQHPEAPVSQAVRGGLWGSRGEGKWEAGLLDARCCQGGVPESPREGLRPCPHGPGLARVHVHAHTQTHTPALPPTRAQVLKIQI